MNDSDGAPGRSSNQDGTRHGEVSDEAARHARIAGHQSPFSGALGIHTTNWAPERVEGRMEVKPWMANRNGVLHGGALMSLADNLSATGTFLNLPEGRSTVTVETKTNFLRAIKVGDVATGVATPYHRGRTTMVWEVRVTRGDGKLAAVVTQTQLVIDWNGGGES
ncbi:PaaI family thioesterase [Acidimangrovimonas sediminis]|uniref:PaaI family thioesterase n=1 Tax=Acidimangrovimonas sediminis TaxID=2056283 RepID=UPI000C7FA08C|nr:PaaI family thioesterase [Acidimangrovimonas sediminis]